MNNEEKILGLLVNLTEKVDNIDGRLGQVEAVQAKQGELLVRMDERLDRVDERLDRMDERLDRMDERLDRMDERLSQVEAVQAKHGELLDRMDERLNQVETVQAKYGEQLAEVLAVQAEHGELLETLDARSLKSAVLLETDVARDIHLLYEGHSAIKQKLDTLATKEQVEELASDVDVIREVVSRHSSDISRLKKAL